jgi:hypothetical protein
MSHVATVAELLDGHVVLDIECLDRVYLSHRLRIMLRTASSPPGRGFWRWASGPPVSSRNRQAATGPLAATRTGLPSAGGDELTKDEDSPWAYVTASPLALLGAREDLTDFLTSIPFS